MDHLEDASHQVLHALNIAVGLDLVKTAEECDDQEVQTLPVHSFADRVQRKYPIHTKQATLLSAAYACYSGESDIVQDKITKMAEFWGCQDEVEKIRQELVDFRPEEKWALDMEICEQPVKAFKYTGPESLKRAAVQFFNQRQRLPYEARKAVARNLMKAAKELQTELPADINQCLDNTLGIGIPDYDRANEMLMARKRASAKLQDWQEDFTTLAQDIQKMAEEVTADTGEQLLEKFATYDEAHGLAVRYENSDLRLPEDRLFPMPFQKISGITEGVVELTNGMTVDVRTIDWEKISQVDPELYAACEKGDPKTATEVLPTWPRSDIEVLAEMLQLA